MNARRTAVRLTFDGVDISADVNRYLQSLSYTDNEQDETDDLQITLDDREGVWLGSWLNSPGASKGAELSAVIIQKNWESDGKDRVLDCGTFQLDSVAGSGPPTKVTIKGGSIPYTSTIRTQKKTQAWEKISLSAIANEIAGKNGLQCMFESAFDPFYERREQVQESDITFLQRLCKAAGISLKVTAKIIVLFDAAEYEQKDAVRTVKRGAADVLRYSFNTSFQDASYSSCHVTYTDPPSGKTYEATFQAPDAAANGSGQVLEINEKVSSNAEAKTLAEKRLREKNGQQFTASFNLVGDARLVAGLTVIVEGYGAFDGKYIIECATHSVSSSGYTTNIKLRRVLEGY
ncbi:phage late control D family protein [Acutalibacter muris]|uniref:phage late control D family protein n=1 Tax=Acutalibacter muris TaxID=1796620 RepID=UPI001C3F03A5|nr:contractile injection system protein, VgrG/Pvc8 family [Acutalibacter muris]